MVMSMWNLNAHFEHTPEKSKTKMTVSLLRVNAGTVPSGDSRIHPFLNLWNIRVMLDSGKFGLTTILQTALAAYKRTSHCRAQARSLYYSTALRLFSHHSVATNSRDSRCGVPQVLSQVMPTVVTSHPVVAQRPLSGICH